MATRLRASLRGYVTKPKTLGLAKRPQVAKGINYPTPTAAKGGNYPAAATPATPAPAPAPAPAAAPAPVAAGGGLPWDTNYETKVGFINRRRDDALAALQNEETATKRDFGFDDVSDPFSRLKTMERMYQQSKAGSLNSMAAGGQLYSGATQQAQDQLQYGETKDRDALRKQYDALLGGITQRRLGINTDAEEGIADANYDRLLAALQNAPEPVAAPAPTNPLAPVYAAAAAHPSEGLSLKPGWKMGPNGVPVKKKKGK